MAIQGGCLCGGVRYEISGELFAASHCHCSMCRRQHGAAFATYAKFNPDDFKWISGEDLVKVYATSSSGPGWCFCGECGSTLAAAEEGKITSVTLGTIEGDPGIKPELHIFIGSRAPWYEINDSLPQFEEWPPDSREPPSKGTLMSMTPGNIDRVARAYTEAWCSGSGAKVASFFSEDATSTINKGEATIGRAAIAEAMGAFFVEFPDLVLRMDDLRTGGNLAIYLWTLEGTNSETGKFVRIAGWQNWVLSDELLIIEANGGYDAKEYDRQVREGV